MTHPGAPHDELRAIADAPFRHRPMQAAAAFLTREVRFDISGDLLARTSCFADGREVRFPRERSQDLMRFYRTLERADDVWRARNGSWPDVTDPILPIALVGAWIDESWLDAEQHPKSSRIFRVALWAFPERAADPDGPRVTEGWLPPAPTGCVNLPDFPATPSRPTPDQVK